jgi:hypothetical protein
VAREIDNAIRMVDAEPVTDPGPESFVLHGDLDDQPVALWGVPPEGDPWFGVPAGALRYRRHVCESGA